MKIFDVFYDYIKNFIKVKKKKFGSKLRDLNVTARAHK